MWGAIAVVCLAVLLNSAAADYSGDGTYYGNNGWEGYCKGNVLAKGGQWPPNNGNWNGLRVAMNKAQLLNGNAWGYTGVCGKFVTIRGTGGGSGGSPISGNWQTAMVTNMCPECKYGDIDFGIGGDGRWNIQWVWGASGGGANHVESVSSVRASAAKKSPTPAPKKICNTACKKANIRAALLKKRRAAAAALQAAKKRAAAIKYNARIRAIRLKQRGRKLLDDAA